MKTLNKTAFALLLAAGPAGPTFAETAANTPPTNNGQTTLRAGDDLTPAGAE